MLAVLATENKEKNDDNKSNDSAEAVIDDVVGLL